MARIGRRGFLAFGAAGAGAAVLGAPGAAQAADAEPLYQYDLAHLYDLDLDDPGQAAAAYDELHFVCTLQGIVNRERPRLYLHFTTHSELGTIDVDEFWLAELQRAGGLLHGRPTRTIGTVEELLATFRSEIRGAVVWDPAVPATSNVASTVAGAADLVALRYDPDPNSLIQRLGLPAQVSLVRPDGSPLFTGAGSIPGTHRKSSGSAKCDAYLWAVEHYLAAGKCRPEFGYFLDGYWLHAPAGKLPQALLTNHDYLVSRRGFIFDLQPWDDERPADDPDQPLGADQRTLEEILRVGYQRSRGEFFPVHGFIPWGYKYTSAAPGGSRHDPVGTEWRFVQVASAFNAYLDADAENLDGMANASVFRHAPLAARYPQGPRPATKDLQARGYLDPAGKVVPKRYVMFYVGDYDSAAWLYQVMPYLWEDPARGSVPLNWAFNPNLAQRLPIALQRARRTATDNDTFIAGDSGAGYINPGMLATPRQFSGLPTGTAAWLRHCAPAFRQWDLTVTGFIIDGNAPGMDPATMRAYSVFSPDGFAAQKIDPAGLVGHTPYVRMGPDLPRASAADGATALIAALDGDLAAAPGAPEFHSVRTILEPPSWHRDVVAAAEAAHPDAALEIVDAHTFYALVRRQLS
jgi:hypothetical protein